MFGPFKSRAQREREAVRDVVIEAILKSEASARSEIRLLESAVEPAVRRQALNRLVNVLVNCGRTEKEVAVWQARAGTLKTKGHLHHALAASLGTRLVACGVLLLHLRGKEWRAASRPFARLEALLSGFVSHYGIDVWPVAYVDHLKFEEYRLALIGDRGARDDEEGDVEHPVGNVDPGLCLDRDSTRRLTTPGLLPGCSRSRVPSRSPCICSSAPRHHGSPDLQPDPCTSRCFRSRKRSPACADGRVASEDLTMSIIRMLVPALLAAASVSALAVDARERGFISLGMAEAEVIFRIGKPDHETFLQNVKGQPEEKTWSDFPQSRDPQTLTIITLRAGVVAKVERKIAR